MRLTTETGCAKGDRRRQRERQLRRGTWRADSTSVALGACDTTGDGGNAGRKTTRASVLGAAEDGDEIMPEAIFREARGGADSDNYYENTMARAGDMAHAFRTPTDKMTRDDYCGGRHSEQ